jgi:orotidine-5'-phosphate decarboxylase
VKTFNDKLADRWAKGGRVCIGLDSDPAKLPGALRHPTGYGSVDIFNHEIVDATKDIALAYKPNIAFYSGRFSPDSLHALRKTIDTIRLLAPDVPVILDAKRADIGNTNAGYVEEAFISFDADAVTVNPYFGMEAMKPFLDQKDKGVIVLCKTSNPGAGEFQDLSVDASHQQMGSTHVKLYEVVAHRVAAFWNYNDNCALVVGATYPKELKGVRKIVGDGMWILIPGIGKQGGDLELSVKNGVNAQGSGIIINSSSGVIFASSSDDYAAAAYRETKKLTESINAALGQQIDTKA